MMPAIVGLVLLSLAIGGELTPGMLAYTATFAVFLAVIRKRKEA